MNEHYFVTCDRGHLRIYRPRQSVGQHDPDLDIVSVPYPTTAEA